MVRSSQTRPRTTICTMPRHLSQISVLTGDDADTCSCVAACVCAVAWIFAGGDFSVPKRRKPEVCAGRRVRTREATARGVRGALVEGRSPKIEGETRVPQPPRATQISRRISCYSVRRLRERTRKKSGKRKGEAGQRWRKERVGDRFDKRTS